MNLKHLVSCLLFTLIAAAGVEAQIAAGLEGRVTDQAGASIANAQVVLTENSTHGATPSDHSAQRRLQLSPT